MAFHHCVHGKCWLWLFWLAVRFLFCFSAGWRSAYLAGDLRFALCGLFVVFCAVNMPSYMTTGVHVDVILSCFFSCKDQASERDRPWQRENIEK